MSLLLVEQAITPVTPAQAKAKMYYFLAELGVSTTSWKPGGVTRLIIAVVAIMIALFSQIAANLARSAWLETSTGIWKRLCARYGYHTEWLPATFAVGTVMLTNAAGGSFSKQIGEVIVRGANGKTYRNTTTFTLGPYGATTIAFAATETGTASNAGVATITQLVTTLTGVTVSNPTAFVALDDETDAALEARAMLKPQSLSPFGPRGAYEWAARAATRQDGTLIGVNRVKVSWASYVSVVTVTVATAAGAVSGDASDPSTDLGAVHLALLANACPQGVTLTTQSGVNWPLDVNFRAFFPTSVVVSLAEQQAIAEAALLAYLADPVASPLGGAVLAGESVGKIRRDTLRDILSQAFVTAGYARPLLVAVDMPTADLTLSDVSAAVLGTVTAVQA